MVGGGKSNFWLALNSREWYNPLPLSLGGTVRINHSYETIEEAVTRQPSREEKITQLERKKRSLLHEMKMLSTQIHGWITSGVISQLNEAEKHVDAPKIPDSETRRILTTDATLQTVVLKTFARFAHAREILSNSVMVELEELQKTPGNISN